MVRTVRTQRKVMGIKWGKNDLKHTNKMIKRIYPTDDPFVDFDRSPIFPRMIGGTVVWHEKYGKPYVFLFQDNQELVFANTEGYDNCWLDCDHVVAANEQQTAQFWAELKANGYMYKNNKIIKDRR